MKNRMDSRAYAWTRTHCRFCNEEREMRVIFCSTRVEKKCLVCGTRRVESRSASQQKKHKKIMQETKDSREENIARAALARVGRRIDGKTRGHVFGRESGVDNT